MQRYLGLLAGIAFAGALASAPILTPKEHYFLRDGQPFFWLGDTAWTLSDLYTPADAEEYLDHRARQGFTVINVTMIFADSPSANPVSADANGNLPFLNWNPATPNEAYFKNIDRVLAAARSKNLILALMPSGGGGFVKKHKVFTEANAREYGRWLGRRYRDTPNLIWVNGFGSRSSEQPEVTRGLAAGLQEGDKGQHLITFHSGGGNSSSYFQTEKWLAYNTIETWSDFWRIHPLVVADYGRLPVKPVILGEGAYEEGPEYPSRPITPHVVREQAWWSFLAGGFHTYGHNDVWRKNPTWRQSLDSPGARQMGILKQVLSTRTWWTLAPDQSVFALGAGSDKDLNAAAASTNGDWAILYLSARNPVTVDFGKIKTSRSVLATWINPETGEATVAGVFPNDTLRPLTPALTSEDAVLLLEATQDKASALK
jgi:hypothetical protein